LKRRASTLTSEQVEQAHRLVAAALAEARGDSEGRLWGWLPPLQRRRRTGTAR
jgi:hypothetical protein